MRIIPIGVPAIVIIQFAWAVIATAEDDEILQRLETRWESAIAEVGLPGVSVAIVRGNGIIYTRGFGVRRLDPNLPFDENTSSYIASITKTFVGTAIMTLVEDGRIDLDASVQRYLPRFEIIDADLSKSITIRDLLCHRYGLNNSIITFAEAYSGIWDDDFYFREMKNTGARGKWNYTNLHFTILGRVIQAVSGKAWQDYLDERLFKPLGMLHTTAYASRAENFADVAHPLEYLNDRWTLGRMKKSDSTMHAAGGIYSTARDMATWIRLFLNKGDLDGRRILAANTVEQMLTPEVEPGTRFFEFTRDEMGLAWYLGRYKGELFVHHFGSFVGFHAHSSFMPDHDLGVVVLANSAQPSSMLIHHMAADVYDAFLDLPGEDILPDLVKHVAEAREREAQRRAERGPLPDGPLTLSQPLDAYTGMYTSEKWGTLELRREGDTLVGNIGNIPFTLHANEEDDLILWYPLGLERISFEVAPSGAVTAGRIASYDMYTLRYTRRDGGTQ